MGKEIHPCVPQDICPLGPLPCSHSTYSADHSKQGIGYRWQWAILGLLVYHCPYSPANGNKGEPLTIMILERPVIFLFLEAVPKHAFNMTSYKYLSRAGLWDHLNMIGMCLLKAGKLSAKKFRSGKIVQPLLLHRGECHILHSFFIKTCRNF